MTQTWFALRIDGRGIRPQRTAAINGKAAPLRLKLAHRNAIELPPFPAEISLARAGYAPFVPTERWRQRRTRHTHDLIELMKPLIPGFCMVLLPDDPPTNWFRLCTVPHVIGVYGKVKGIREQDVYDIIAMEARLWSNNPFGLKQGDRALPHKGALKGQEISIEQVLVDTPDAVAHGLVRLFGRQVRITVPIEQMKGAL